MAAKSLGRGAMVIEETLGHQLFKLVILAVVVIPVTAIPICMWFLWNQYVGLFDVLFLSASVVYIAFGVTVGFHRHFTHQSFEAHPGVRVFLGIGGLLALENTIVSWVANHKYHHAFSDLVQDLHSPMGDLWHAHVGWFFDDVAADPKLYASHLLRDRLVLTMDRFYPLIAVMSVVVPFVVGLLRGYLFWESEDILWVAFQTWIWTGLLRILLVHHFTWSINSICHTFGKRPFRTPTNDQSANVAWLVLSMGEQYHNNHHAKQRSARHGPNIWLDPSFAFIKLLERLGWVSDVYVPKDEEYEALRVTSEVA